MQNLPYEDLYELALESTDIVSLAGKYTALERRSNKFWGRCPFHKEETVSFMADESRQIYHCFGCGASGNAVTFLCRIKNLNEREAVNELVLGAAQ